MKNILIILFAVILFGCSNLPTMTFYSNPPGAMISVAENPSGRIAHQGIAPLFQTFTLPKDLKCGVTGQIKALWNNGRNEVSSFTVCEGQNYQHTFTMTEIGGYTPSSGGSRSSSSVNTAKDQCKDLGFKPGTEKFGSCVLELNK
jgi:hypothetical protein